VSFNCLSKKSPTLTVAPTYPFHVIPVYLVLWTKKEWHRLYSTEEVSEGFWYFGYKEHQKNMAKNSPDYEEKLNEYITKRRDGIRSRKLFNLLDLPSTV